ncbi:hypothetical protein BGX29_003212 [Mortierella sp. GBA35]|nr:hypothetical protein BGX29_003212 [Mortierella sp. GBA35]
MSSPSTSSTVMSTLRPVFCTPSFLGGSTLSYVRETSELDPKTKRLTMKTQNLSMCNVLTINETVTYTIDPQDESTTMFKQEAEIVAGSSLSRFSSYVEDFCLTRFRDNAAVGRKGFETVLEKLKVARQEATTQLEKATSQIEKATSQIEKAASQFEKAAAAASL